MTIYYYLRQIARLMDGKNKNSKEIPEYRCTFGKKERVLLDVHQVKEIDGRPFHLNDSGSNQEYDLYSALYCDSENGDLTWRYKHTIYFQIPSGSNVNNAQLLRCICWIAFWNIVSRNDEQDVVDPIDIGILKKDKIGLWKYTGKSFRFVTHSFINPYYDSEKQWPVLVAMNYGEKIAQTKENNLKNPFFVNRVLGDCSYSAVNIYRGSHEIEKQISGTEFSIGITDCKKQGQYYSYAASVRMNYGYSTPHLRPGGKNYIVFELPEPIEKFTSIDNVMIPFLPERINTAKTKALLELLSQPIVFGENFSGYIGRVERNKNGYKAICIDKSYSENEQEFDT